MITFIIALVLSVSALFGSAPSSQVSPTPQGGAEVGVNCEEDMACWDPSTMGNGQGGNAMEADAYASFDSLGTDPASHEGMVLTYVATYDYSPTTYSPNQFIMYSVQYPNTYHVLQWDVLTEA